MSLRGVATPANGSSDIALAREGLLGLPWLANPLMLMSSGCVDDGLKPDGERARSIARGLKESMKLNVDKLLEPEVLKPACQTANNLYECCCLDDFAITFVWAADV